MSKDIDVINRGIDRINREVKAHRLALRFAREKGAAPKEIADLLIKIEEKHAVVAELQAIISDDETRRRIIYCRTCAYCKESEQTPGHFRCKRLLDAGTTPGVADVKVTDFCSKGKKA